jgi:hypothetical protein
MNEKMWAEGAYRPLVYRKDIPVVLQQILDPSLDLPLVEVR